MAEGDCQPARLINRRRTGWYSSRPSGYSSAMGPRRLETVPAVGHGPTSAGIPPHGDMVRRADSALHQLGGIEVAKTRGWILWPVIHREDAVLIGFCGFSDEFPPDVEIGWRFLPEYSGRGLATRAATAVMRYGFDTFQFARLVSVRHPANRRSLRVIEKLGMTFEKHFIHKGAEVVLRQGEPLQARAETGSGGVTQQFPGGKTARGFPQLEPGRRRSSNRLDLAKLIPHPHEDLAEPVPAATVAAVAPVAVVLGVLDDHGSTCASRRSWSWSVGQAVLPIIPGSRIVDQIAVGGTKIPSGQSGCLFYRWNSFSQTGVGDFRDPWYIPIRRRRS